ncbi:MAG TPA: enoyl-CoA hydratase/isomerase family protein [Candidatus Sulfotelmatobacter sp.]|nr:enoyl-CoA hydratase/isomerase family protein [Candidatus Sulfotelmatobacter sp.]
MTDTLLLSVDHGVATLTLNRPEIHNAFDDRLIAALAERYRALDADPAVRAVVLAANGASFSAGADLNWMRRMASYTEAENIADARALAELLRLIDRLSKPTIARVQGSAFAGGLGLIAVHDIVIAASVAAFAVTEVRIGLIPAVISPYLVRAIGPRAARRLFLTAERFDAAEARRIGLVHEVVAPEALDATVERHLAALRGNSTQAMAASKALVEAVDRPIDDALIEHTVRGIAAQRASADGVEGLSAFLEKRKPRWARDA